MKMIKGLKELQQLSLGNPAIKIAVLDGPVDLKHPCFNTSEGQLAPIEPKQIWPSSGLALAHGTAVTSLIFGKPGSAVEGVAPGCRGLIIPIYAQEDDGSFSSASQVELARAIEKAIEQGANIINISGGQFSKTGDVEFLLEQAIDKCIKAGVLIVAAAGNEGCYCLHVPAANQQVLAVGSLDESGEPTTETNFGAHYQKNGILVQGKNLVAAKAGGGTFKTNGGTSYATPIVSGITGLLMSIQIQQGHKPDAYAIRSILEQTAIPCIADGTTDCRRFMQGKLNLPAVLAAIRNNPEILASGMKFNQTKNNIAMEHQSKQGHYDAPEMQQVVLAVQPADNAALEPQEKLHNVAEPAAETESPIIEQEQSPAAPEEPTGTPELAPKTTMEPSDAGEPIQKTTITYLTNKNKLKMEHMEKFEQGYTAESQEHSQPESLATVLAPSGEIDPSDCGCGGKADPPGNVYALGTLGYDFGSEAHRDSFIQSMGGGNPHDPGVMLDYLNSNPWDAEELLWTLNIDATPIYAIMPHGPYATIGFQRLREFLQEQFNGNIQRISLAGVAKGSTSMLMGHKVTNLWPRLRGMYAWTTEALVEASTSGAKGSSKALAENVTNFLNRVYYKMRNLGVSPAERALNFAATNAFQVSAVFAAALKENLELDDISASKSPICRPGADCYDVVLSFFNPKERLTQARKQYRFTIDVTDIVPVTVGEVRSWSVY